MNVIVSIPKNKYQVIKRFGTRGYTIRINAVEDNDYINCEEVNLYVSKQDKESLIKAIVECKYSPEDVNLILCSKINNGETPEYIEYMAWLDYAKKCASIIFDAPTLENAINAKIEEIVKYDTSSAVNSFSYQGNGMWLDKATRVGLMNSTSIQKAAGETTTTLWLGSYSFTLPVDDVIAMLSQLEIYALECYNVTAQHKVAVAALQTIEAVEAYDITADYPAKLVWN